MSHRSRLTAGAVVVFLSWLPGFAGAATQCVNQNAPNPLEICLTNSGTPSIWVAQPNGRQHQYYDADSWGSALWLNGTDVSQSYSTGYFGTQHTVTPVSNGVSGSGTAADPYVITNIVDLGTSARLTQRFVYVNGDRTVRKTWSLENTTAGTTFSDVRFLHGGDTYFGGVDSARSWWDAANSMIYVTNESFSNSGLMGFFANPATPAAHYFGGSYGSVYSYASTDPQLPDTADSSYVDAGYALQWNRASLAPGQTWTFEGFETWSTPGALQVIAPADDYVIAGTTVDRVFKVHNLTSGALDVNLSAASTPADWSVSLPNGNTINVAGLTVVEVPVSVVVPADAAGDSTRLIEVSGSSGSYSNAGTTRLTVLQANYTILPDTLSFVGVPVGESEALSVTLTNGPSASPVEIGQLGTGNGLAAPFAITSDSCSNTTINAGGTCVVEVTYARADISASADSFAWPVLSPVITTQTITVESPALPSEHNVTSTAGSGGSISPASVQVTDGSTTAFTVTPSTGYSIANVSGCDGSLVGSTYMTGAITSACAVTATFTLNTYTITTAAGAGGSVTPPSSNVAHGSTTAFTVTPSTGYSIANVSGCGGSLVGSTYTTGAITSACAVAASFAINVYTVNASAGEGGGITPATSNVAHGGTASFIVTPSTGYSIQNISGCGGSLSGNTYTTAAVTGACAVSASFLRTQPSFEPASLPDLDVNATGLMTRLPEDIAPRAFDFTGEELEVTLVGGQTHFAPASHTLTWRATDSRGVAGTLPQTLRLWPIVSMGGDVSIGFVQGNSGSFRVALNGPAPQYPYIVAYEVSGYLEGHDIESGTARFEAGETEKDVLFAVLETPAAGTPTQSVSVTLVDVRNPGDRDSLEIELRTVNSAPRVQIAGTQEGEPRAIFGRALGAITLTADIRDPDSADTHTVQWQSPTGAVVTATGNTLVLTADSLAAGIYRFVAVINDSAVPSLSARGVIDIALLDVPPPMPNGVGNTAPNGIMDDPQYSPALPSVLPERESELTSYLIETEAGLQLRLGPHALYQKLYQSELESLQASALTADTVLNVGGYFDFVVSELPSSGQSVSIVIPQRAQIPSAPAYRKFHRATQQWRNFMEGPGDSLASAPGEAGHCPPPASSAYRAGLNTGDWCVRVIISDGGPNDADGEVNGVVADPGGVGTLSNVLVTTSGQGNGGGGSVNGLLLMTGVLILLLRGVRTRSAVTNGRFATRAALAPVVVSLAVFFGMTSSASASEAGAGGMTVGMHVGFSQGDINESDMNSRLADAGLDATASFDNRKRTAWQVSAAYDLTSHFGLSLGYIDLGEVNTRIEGNVTEIEEALDIANRVHPHSADGYELAVTGRLPLFGRLAVTGRAGALRWESRYRATNIDGQFARRKETGTDEFFGVGLEVPVFSRWRIQGDFSRYRIDRETIEFIGIGVSFRIE